MREATHNDIHISRMKGFQKIIVVNTECSLITQPMMQRQPNPMELRSMDSYIQILCRFQKSKQKVPAPSLPCTKKSPFTPHPPNDEKKLTKNVGT